jgi:endonuclease III
MTRLQRARELAQRFPRIYPDAHCELDFKSPLELLVATILSAQCTDKRVNIVTKNLFQRCRNARDYAEIPQEELEEIIRSTGFYRNKAKSIRAMAAKLISAHDGEVPRTLAALAALPGVGRKTANVVLGNAFGIEEGVVVDTHVSRVSARLGLTKTLDPIKIEQELMTLFPRDQWTLLSHWLIWHGRRRCFAKKPDCPHCELADICPTGRKLLSQTTSASLPARRRVERPLSPRVARR